MLNDNGKVEFSWKELFSSAEGRTSGSCFVAVTSSLVCLLLFCTVLVFYFFHTGESAIILDIIDKITVYFSISAALLGVNKITSKIGKGVASFNIGDSSEEEKPKKRHKRQALEDDASYEDENCD